MATDRRLNIDALERAHARLGRFIARAEATGAAHPDRDVYHTAIVKGFEFTYELAFGAIRRYVADYVLSPGQVGRMRIPDILRVAARNGLVTSLEDWFEFRERRNLTAHEYYDEEAAERIVDAAPAL